MHSVLDQNGGGQFEETKVTGRGDPPRSFGRRSDICKEIDFTI